MSSSASRVWTTSGRPVCARRVDMRLEPLALRGAVGLVVIIIEPAFADGDHARMCRGLDQRGAPRSGWASASCGWTPTVAQTSALRSAAPTTSPHSLLAGRNVEKTGDSARPGVGQHLLLPLGKAGVIEVAMAIDQPHAASPPPRQAPDAGRSGSAGRSARRPCRCRSAQSASRPTPE